MSRRWRAVVWLVGMAADVFSDVALTEVTRP